MRAALVLLALVFPGSFLPIDVMYGAGGVAAYAAPAQAARIYLYAFGLALALLTPNLLHLWSVRTEDWGAADGHRFGADFLARNLASNAGYFVQQKWFPLAGTLLALGGAGWLARHRRWFGVTALGWFLLSWGIFVLFYAGGYYYGASSRYAVISSASVALPGAAAWIRSRIVANSRSASSMRPAARVKRRSRSAAASSGTLPL